MLEQFSFLARRILVAASVTQGILASCARVRLALPNQRGVVGIIGVLAYSAIILVIGGTMVTTSVINYQVSNKRIASTQNIYNADSGAEDALMMLRKDNNYNTNAGALVTQLDPSNTNSVTTDIDDITQPPCNPAKKITANGHTGNLQRNIQLTNCGKPSTDIDFAYALQAGGGGIRMDNNSQVVGSTYSNYNHDGGNGANVAGDVWVAGAPAPSATPQWDPANPTDFQFGNSTNANVIDVAQSFIADTSSSATLIKVSLKLKKVGSPVNPTVRIVADNNNRPSNNQIASGTLNAASVGLGYGFIDVGITTPPTLTNGTRYWIVIDTDASPVNFWNWAQLDGYTNGKGMSSPQWRSAGPMTWNETNADFAFKVFMGAPPTHAQNLTIGGHVHANTITNNTIAGDAFFQVNDGSTVLGTSNPGSADPPTIPLPISDANAQDFKDEGSAGTIYNGNYTVPTNGTATLGPARINGDLTVSNGATLVVTGTIYVTGNVTYENNSHINLDVGFGTNSGVVVSDGTIIIANNTEVNTNLNSFLMMLTTSTSEQAIIASNNSTSLVLAAIHGTIVMVQNANANAIVAYRLHLEENAVVTYLQGLQNVHFTAGPGARFTAQGWKEVVCDATCP